MRISEIYLSIQGEGPNVGFPTIFVRFGGCNLRCALWPCDTPYAIFPRYRDQWDQLTPLAVFNRIEEARQDRFVNICFTGGEPFLQKHSELHQLYELLRLTPGVNVIEAFSNGALLYPPWIASENLQIVMDWKLPGSGEETEVPARYDNLALVEDWRMSVKFTIASIEDYEIAKEHFRKDVVGQEVFAGVVWGKLENQELVEWILRDKLPWKLNVQVHNHIWDRSQRGI